MRLGAENSASSRNLDDGIRPEFAQIDEITRAACLVRAVDRALVKAQELTRDKAATIATATQYSYVS